MALGISERSATSSRRWSGCSASTLPAPADQAGGGLVPCSGDDVHDDEELVAREAPDLAGLVLELGVEQLGHEVVGGVLRPPVDVLLEDRPVDELLLVDLHGLALVGLEIAVDLVAHRFLIGLGDAEQHADGAHGHLRAEVGDEVELAAAHQGVEAAGAELAELRLEGVHLPRREHPREQPPVHRVDGRVLEDEHARGHLDVGPDQLEDRRPWPRSRWPSRRAPGRRRRTGSARRSRAARCSRAAPPRGGVRNTGYGSLWISMSYGSYRTSLVVVTWSSSGRSGRPAPVRGEIVPYM